MSDMLGIGLSGLAGAARSYAAQRPEKETGGLGKALKIGLAAAQVGATIGGDVLKGMKAPTGKFGMKTKTVSGGSQLETAETAASGMQEVGKTYRKWEPMSRDKAEKVGAVGGGLFGLITALAE